MRLHLKLVSNTVALNFCRTEYDFCLTASIPIASDRLKKKQARTNLLKNVDPRTSIGSWNGFWHLS